MRKAIVFDMDDTLNLFSKVPRWLSYLEKEDVYPYVAALPKYNMRELSILLNVLKEQGWTICITSWLSKCGSKDFMNRIREAKRNWLDDHEFPYDELHFVKYGTPKHKCTRGKYDIQVLIDDNESVRNSWRLGPTFDGNNDCFEFLYGLIEEGH